MRIAIIGAGGVGGYFGGRLAQAGEEVIFIARGDHLKVIREKGLRVDSLAGDFILPSVEVTDDPSQVEKVDVVILGVKAWQVKEAAQTIKPLLGEDTCVLPLQNGIEAPAQLIEILGDSSVLGGLCALMTYIVAPGHIRHMGGPPSVKFGELDNRRSERVERLQEAFEKTIGVSVEIPADIEAAMWQKFMFISASSGVGAITRSPFGIFRSQPGTRQMLIQAMEEICDVAQAHKIDLPKTLVAKTMKFFDNLPEAATASMQRDIMEGRPSELEVQNGAVVRLGKKAGVETPITAFIYHSLLALEKKARGEVQFSD